MIGSLILVVGPSGVGKDSIINGAKRKFEHSSDFYFPRRYITRAHSAGGENHIEVSLDAFSEMRDTHQFCLHWQAHGLHYGLPVDITRRISEGQTVIVNGSRSVLETARQQFEQLHIAHVIASEENLRKRLTERGRENAEDIERRIKRSTDFKLAGDNVTVINNSGSLDQAIDQLITISQIPSMHSA